MKILVVGDIVGRPGRAIMDREIIRLRDEYKLDLVIANCENAAAGAGITRSVADELFRAGVDVLTSGNHVWKLKEAYELLKLDPRVIRPANYPNGAPGSGSTVVETLGGQKVGVLNVMGRVFMEPLDCPFRTAERELERLRLVTPVIVVDMHAEATSEKVAMGWFLDGKVSVVFGTHTHIPTADERVLPKGTAFITDIGMTGPYDSVIGRRVDQILQRFLSNLPMRSEVADGNIQLHGLIIEVHPTTGKASSVQRIKRTLDGTVRDQ
ncbi:MAG: TIGR00282 family metallophosphoesterase [Candidatus Omnitrophica bacterium CG11_big_fil_rev_8_21_14_0_20_63_9]|nr:MAG: TIGR00282 family metallophosphoesterase [Candidatus Omnitrophica bacterium CG11_big_fil_rev_8_21_14_0_20_63_9]